MDELKRIAELLRPLWPGVVMVADKGRLHGRVGSVTLTVSGGMGFDGDSWCCSVDIHRNVLHNSKPWLPGKDAAVKLQKQRADVEAIIHDLHMALGLEVADG